MGEEIKAIESQEEWNQAASELLSIVAKRKDIVAQCGEEVKNSRAHYKAATESRDILDKPLKEREAILRSSMSLFKSDGNADFSVREKVDFFIDDESLIPRKFLEPNLKLIKEVVESMGVMAHIPGIGIAHRYPVYLRTKKESK